MAQRSARGGESYDFLKDPCDRAFKSEKCLADTKLRELYFRDVKRNISYYFHRLRYGNVLYQGDGTKHFLCEEEFCHCCDLSKDSFEFQRQLLTIPYDRWQHFQSGDPLWELEIYFDNDYYICASGRESKPYGYERLLQILSLRFKKERN